MCGMKCCVIVKKDEMSLSLCVSLSLNWNSIELFECEKFLENCIRYVGVKSSKSKKKMKKKKDDPLPNSLHVESPSHGHERGISSQLHPRT